MTADPRAMLRAMPWVFVLIWSTGFIVARLAMPHAPPMGFLAVRYAASLLCFGAWIVISGARWPVGAAQWTHLSVCGILMHAGYLGGVWAAVKHGIGAGTVALLVGLQPVLTALWLRHAGSGHGGHAVSRRQWLGLGLGLLGVTLVLWRKLGVGEITPANLGLAIFALCCITVGTLYQKRFVATCDVRTANSVQILAALLATLPFAAFETEPLVWHRDLILALSWSVLVLTLGGSSLLYLLIQRGAATAVTSLLYLVPPCTAAMAWLLFGESFTPLMFVGVLLTAFGVWLVVRTAPA